MEIKPLPITASLQDYQQQAGDLPDVSVDTRQVIADQYHFESWEALAAWVEAVTQQGSPVNRFERAVDAITGGDTATLQILLAEDPSLIRVRSVRRHHATLLHYTGTNGVEGYRQQYPANAIEIVNILLAAGAEVDAEADMYGGGATTLGLVATSIHPSKAGIMVPLLETLLAAGAATDHPGAAGNGQYAVNGCLHNGRPEAADYLARRGAHLDLEGAAGVGRLDIVTTFFNEDDTLKATATRKQMEYGYIWACEFGHTAVIDFLMARGIDPATQVDGMNGLHRAMIGGHANTIRLLIDKKVPLEDRNMYGGTALGAGLWAAIHSEGVYRWPKAGDDLANIELLLKAGAAIEPGTLQWLEQEKDMPAARKEALDKLLRRYGAAQ